MPDAYQVTTVQGYEVDTAATDEAWRALWEQSPQRSPFSTLAYNRALAAVLDLDLHLIGIQDDAQTWQAAALLPVRQRGPFHQVLPTPFTPFSAVLCAAPPDEAAVHQGRSAWQALSAALAGRYHHVSLLLPPAFDDVRPLTWQDWSVSPLYTYLLDLQHHSDAQHHWSASTRRLFRKEGARFTVQEAPDAVDAVVALCDFAYERHDRSLLLAPERLVHLAQRLQQVGLVRTFVARSTSTNAIDAGVCILHDGHTAAYWIAGSKPGAAMTVLLGEMLPRLRADGLHTFDFVGANTPSIAEFKRRFGAVLTPYYHAEIIPNRLLRLLYALRRAG